MINLSNSIASINTNNSTNTNNDDYQKQLRKASDEFASMYIYEVFKKMYDTVPKSGFLQDSFGESWFREMLLQDYALKSAKTDLKSVSDMIYKSIGGEETSQDSENSQDSQTLQGSQPSKLTQISQTYVNRLKSIQMMSLLNSLASIDDATNSMASSPLDALLNPSLNPLISKNQESSE